MPKFLMVLHAVLAYVFFLGVFLLLVAFVGDLPVPKTVDNGTASPLGLAVSTDLALIALFGVEHSVMARPVFIAFRATPRMSAGHLLLAAGFTAYIVVGVWFDERDLVAQFGERYRLCRGQAGMIVPRFRKNPR